MNADERLARSQWDTFWVPEDVTLIDRPELRALVCPRDLLELNVVVHCHAAADRLPGLVDEVERAHAGRTSRFMVGPLDSGAALEPLLRARGWRVTYEHHGFVLDVDRWPEMDSPGILTRPVTDLAGLDTWLAVTRRAFAQDHVASEADRRRFLRACTGPGARVHREVAYDAATGEPLAAGGMTLFPDLGLGLLWSGGTVPNGRGRGAYKAVLRARAAHAASHGLGQVGLYARVDSSGPIVARLGFTRLAPMRFWDRTVAPIEAP